MEQTPKQPNLCCFIADVLKAKQYIYHLLRKTSAYQLDQWYFSFAARPYLTNSYAFVLPDICAQGQYLTAYHRKAIVNLLPLTTYVTLCFFRLPLRQTSFSPPLKNLLKHTNSHI